MDVVRSDIRQAHAAIKTGRCAGHASSGSRLSPAASADEFAPKRQWDIQVATVGLRPLAPTIQVGCHRRAPFHAHSGFRGRSWSGANLSGRREILNRPT